MYLIDTNVLSEARRGSPQALGWMRSVDPDRLHLSVITLVVKQQTQSAFGALQAANVGVNTRELSNVDPTTFQKIPVDVVDVSGRPYLSYAIDIPKWQMLGDYDVFLTPEFFRALVLNAGLTVHLDLVRGDNPHHIVEAAFKAFARALDAAITPDPRVTGVPSTKGAL